MAAVVQEDDENKENTGHMHPQDAKESMLKRTIIFAITQSGSLVYKASCKKIIIFKAGPLKPALSSLMAA